MPKFDKYPKTHQFEIIDVIPVTHLFCITAALVGYASDNFSGILSNNAVEAYEKKMNKGVCGVKNCNMLQSEHQVALLIEVRDPRELNNIPELQDYLLKCKPICEADGYAGFAFKLYEDRFDDISH